MSKTTNLSKPMLTKKSKSEVAMASAESGATSEKTSVAQGSGEKRAFFAPVGYRRLTINLREDLHKKLRFAAVEQDCNATDIIERLLINELKK